MTLTTLGEAARAVVAAHADNPAGARLTTERLAGAVDELGLLAEAHVELQAFGRDEMDQRAARQSGVYVFGSHASGSNTPAEALVSPVPLKQAEER